MMPGLLSFLGIDEDELEGNGIVDGKTRLREGDVTPAELVSSGAATPEAATLLNGLFGQVMQMEAPTDPGKTFNDYLGDQGGFKGFMGDVVGEPILNSLFFGKDEDTYDQLKSDYGLDKKRYDSLFEIATAGEVQRVKNDAPDAQDTRLADLRRQGITSGPLWDAAVIEAGGVDKYDANDTTLASGGVRIDHQGNVVARNPRNDPLTTQERNLRERDELYKQEPQDKASAEWKAWDQRRQFFESSVRANPVVNGTLYSGVGNGPVGGDRQPYLDNTREQTLASSGAEQQVESADKLFTGGYTRARDAAGQFRDYDDRIMVVEDAIGRFEAGDFDTNMVRGMILNATGLGSYEDGELRAMGTDESINKVTNFNGHTTDFEYGEAFKAAFADLMSNTNVNLGTLNTVLKGLQRGQEQAYKEWQSGVADMVGNVQTDGEGLSLQRQNTFNRRRYSNAPDLGHKEDGMLYVGGDPGNPDNWLEVK